jgi:hypothetical protein
VGVAKISRPLVAVRASEVVGASEVVEAASAVFVTIVVGTAACETSEGELVAWLAELALVLALDADSWVAEVDSWVAEVDSWEVEEGAEVAAVVETSALELLPLLPLLPPDAGPWAVPDPSVSKL